jgi:DNA-3-methyladenine glycosylase
VASQLDPRRSFTRSSSSRTPPAARRGAAAERPGPAEERRLRLLLERPAAQAARALLGQILVRLGRVPVAARIVETEAYLGPSDPASHAYRGRTPRTEPLFGPAGSVYVYFVYGMHHCLNLSVDPPRTGCVLLRAAEPLDGAAADAGLGPGRLCRWLRLDRRHSGAHLFDPASPLTLREGQVPRRVGVSKRIGIRRAADLRLRFYDADSPAVSGPRARPGPTRAQAKRSAAGKAIAGNAADARVSVLPTVRIRR